MLPDLQTPHPFQPLARLCVRDALFLLAHNESRGFTSRLHPAVLAPGLAAATLIDLVLLGKVRMSVHGSVYPVGQQPVNDVVLQAALDALRTATPLLHSDPQPHPASLPVPEALALLADNLIERTLAHLVARGVLIVHRRRLGRIQHSPATTTTLDAAITTPRITVLDGTLDPQGLALCALVQALDLHDALYLSGKAHLDPHLTRAVNTMRQLPDPLNAVPRITDVLRTGADELIPGVYR